MAELKPEQVPLTLRETGEHQLDRFKDLNAKMQDLTKDVRDSALTAAGVPVKKPVIALEFKKGEWLSAKLAQELFGLDFGQLSRKQQYVIALIDAILKQDGIYSDKINVGDRMTFNFVSGVCSYRPVAEGAVGKDVILMLVSREEITDKARAETEALLADLEEKGILFDAMRRFGDDPSMEGRINFLKGHYWEMVGVMHQVLGDSNEMLVRPLPNMNYRGSSLQNRAYLKAYLAVKRREKLGGATESSPEEVQDLEQIEKEKELLVQNTAALLGLENTNITIEEAATGIENFSADLRVQLENFSKKFLTKNGETFVGIGASKIGENSVIGTAAFKAELIGKNGVSYPISLETSPVALVTLQQYIDAQAALGNFVDRNTMLLYLPYRDLAKLLKEELEKMDQKIQQDLEKFEKAETVLAPEKADTAEAIRLRGEIKILSEKLAWTGVERKYQELLALNHEKGVLLTGADYIAGAYAALNMGSIADYADRMNEAILMQPEQTELKEQFDSIDRAFGHVDLNLAAHANVTLEKEGGLPFAPHERAAIELAKKTLLESGKFSGFLPIGNYILNGKTIVVE